MAGPKKVSSTAKRDASVRQARSISSKRMDRLTNSERGQSNGTSRPSKPSGFPSTRRRR